jgi:hypothetical protein
MELTSYVLDIVKLLIQMSCEGFIQCLHHRPWELPMHVEIELLSKVVNLDEFSCLQSAGMFNACFQLAILLP